MVDDISLVVIGSALMALCAHVSFPLLFSPVPLTLQTFGVMLIALVLGPKRAAAAMALYLVEGASGLPVFSPAGPGGIAQLAGPTGGFLLAYPFAAFLIGKLFDKTKTTGAAQIACLAGEGVLFASGMLWLLVAAHLSLGAAFMVAVLPFVPGEIIKIAAASFLGAQAKRRLARFHI
jgi:biotin transport system substrate-specific component